ncbi:MAG: AAA family ATPase [Muribaculum sp.]|nr:AAA family ATPase [Muribaculum sp.]
MNELLLRNYKAFESLELDIPDKEGSRNALIYGENGAGKSSIFDAIRYFYFKDKVRKIPPNIIGVDRDNKIKEFDENLASKFSRSSSFTLKIDDIEYNPSSVPPDVDVFMLSYDDIANERDKIVINDLLSNAYFKYDESNNSIDDDFIQVLIGHVNEALLNEFKIELSVSLHANGYLIFKDNVHNLKRGTDLNSHFNESRITIVKLLVLFGAIFLLKNKNRQPLIVLDDIITSLDSGSRYALVKYILDSFDDSQIIILTHNAGFFNLIHYISEAFRFRHSKFTEFELYTVDGIHKLQEKTIKDSSKIEADYKATNDIQVAGNEIRQCFESNLVSLSRYFRIGAIEETKDVIEQILLENPIYFKEWNGQLKGHKDLIMEIKNIISNKSNKKIPQQVKNKIAEYENKRTIQELVPIVRELNALKKISMHPASHGRNKPQINVTTKEIMTALGLLKEFEKLNGKAQKYMIDMFPL